MTLFIFKNYLAIVFSANKQYPNRPLIFKIKNRRPKLGVGSKRIVVNALKAILRGQDFFQEFNNSNMTWKI